MYFQDDQQMFHYTFSIQIIIEILVYLSLTNVQLWPIQQKIVRSMYRNVNEILSMICRHGSYISIKRKYKRKIRRVYNDALVIYYHEHMNDLSSFEGVKYRMDIDKHIFQMTQHLSFMYCQVVQNFDQCEFVIHLDLERQ